MTYGLGGINWRVFSELFAEDLANLIIKLSQSQNEFGVNDDLDIEFDRVQIPVGRGFTKLTDKSANLIKKRSIVFIRNHDKYCLPRALVIAEAFFNKGLVEIGDAADHYKAVRTHRDETAAKGQSSVQKKYALQLVRGAEVAVPKEGCGLPEIKEFQEIYTEKGLAIMVYD